MAKQVRSSLHGWNSMTMRKLTRNGGTRIIGGFKMETLSNFWLMMMAKMLIHILPLGLQSTLKLVGVQGSVAVFAAHLWWEGWPAIPFAGSLAVLSQTQVCLSQWIYSDSYELVSLQYHLQNMYIYIYKYTLICYTIHAYIYIVTLLWA